MTAYLCKRAWVELVLGRNLQTDVATCGRVPGGLGAGLDLGVDLVVVARAEDAQVVRRGDGGGVAALRVSCGESVAGDGGLADIVTSFCADEETLMAERDVESGGWALEQVGEQACVDVGLLVEQVELAAVGALRGEVVGQDLGLETLGQVVLKLDLEV